jgi:hypothetical protein
MRRSLTNAIKFPVHRQGSRGARKKTSISRLLSWGLGVLLVHMGVFAAAPPVRAADPAALEESNRLLKAEYQLAQKEQLYFLFDLPGRQVQVKASGVVLARFPIRKLQRRGVPGQEGLRSLAERRALSAPQRVTISPRAEQKKSGKFELQALEIDHMPSAYRLLLDDGSVLAVNPEGEGFWGHAAAWPRELWWRLSRPLISGWYLLRRKPYTELRLTLTAHDARRLYWSFQEGMPCLIAWRIP